MLVYTLQDMFSLFLGGVAFGAIGISSFFAWLEVRRWKLERDRLNKRKGIK